MEKFVLMCMKIMIKKISWDMIMRKQEKVMNKFCNKDGGCFCYICQL